MSAVTLGRDPRAVAPSRDAVMAQAGAENFPVATRILGAGARRQLMALYGFARLADDIGDEASGDRLAMLDWLEEELDIAFAAGRPEHPIMRKLAESLSERPLPDGPFRRLIEANRMDQAVTRYETFDQLLGYCRLSANPVGELVLHVFEQATPDRIELSDRICSALQVIEHLQDMREDHGRGRVYIPQEDLRRFGCQEAELGAPRASDPLRRLTRFQAERAGFMLSAGAPLATRLSLRSRCAVAGFVAGGRAALGGIERAGFDTLQEKPPLRPRAFATGWLRAVRGR